MKLDAKALRYISREEFRVLTATEMGSKNHEVVPTSLISSIAALKSGGVQKILSELARHSLVARVVNARYDGYRLTYGGYDYLALKTLTQRGAIVSVGNQIGVGKESDVYLVADKDGNQLVLKIHRLGRVSFRNIKSKRDYLRNRKSASWMYLSRLAATKEFAFMKVLYDHGFPVPTPVDFSRHQVVMSLVNGIPLYQVQELEQPGKLYADLMELIVRLARHGLIHCDFNEFNLLVDTKGKPVIIDFPQMVSTSHANAEWYFDRDVECVRTFFKKRYGYETSARPRLHRDANVRDVDLDVLVFASGFTQKQQDEMERLTAEQEKAEPASFNEEEFDDETYEYEDEEGDEGQDEEIEENTDGSQNNGEAAATEDGLMGIEDQQIRASLASEGIDDTPSQEKLDNVDASENVSVETALKEVKLSDADRARGGDDIKEDDDDDNNDGDEEEEDGEDNENEANDEEDGEDYENDGNEDGGNGIEEINNRAVRPHRDPISEEASKRIQASTRNPLQRPAATVDQEEIRRRVAMGFKKSGPSGKSGKGGVGNKGKEKKKDKEATRWQKSGGQGWF